MPPSRKTGATARKESGNVGGLANDAIASGHSDPTSDKYAPTAWGGSAYEDLSLPSGQLCLARRVGIQGLLEAGIIHDIDPLMGLVSQHEDRMQGKPAKSEEDTIMELLKDEGKTASLFHMLDRIVCHVVVKPHVEMTPNDITRRKDGVVYTDMVDMGDKMFIMQWAMGGAQAVAGFRDKYQELVGSVQSEPGDGNTTE